MKVLLKSTSSPIIVSVSGAILVSNQSSVLDLVVAGKSMGAEYNPRLVNAVVNVVSTNNMLPNVTSEVRIPINSGDYIDVMIKTNGNGRTMMPSVIASTVIEGSMQGDITGNVTGYRIIEVSNTTMILETPNALTNSKLIMHPGSPVMSLAPIVIGDAATGAASLASAIQRSQVHSVKFGTMVTLLLTKDEADATLIASTVTNMPSGFSLSSDSKSLTGLVAFTGTLSVGVTYSDDSTQTHYLESFVYDILNGS
jgi:hypothetical protein